MKKAWPGFFGDNVKNLLKNCVAGWGENGRIVMQKHKGRKGEVPAGIPKIRGRNKKWGQKRRLFSEKSKTGGKVDVHF